MLKMMGESKMEAPMDVKEAVRMAKEYLVELFAEESISDVGLEEVKFEDPSNKWNITIGFSRPWDQKNSLANALGEPIRLVHIRSSASMTTLAG